MRLFGHVTGVRAGYFLSHIIKEELLETIIVWSAVAEQLLPRATNRYRQPEPARFQLIQWRDNGTGLRQQICRRLHIGET
jgi:hypothetical protein